MTESYYLNYRFYAYYFYVLWNIIRMYCAPREHNPPHIHVLYKDHKAIVDIHNSSITKGFLPNKQKKLVLAWVELRKEELLADWEISQRTEKPFRIDPLK